MGQLTHYNQSHNNDTTNSIVPYDQTNHNNTYADETMIDIPPQPSTAADEATLFTQHYNSTLTLNQFYYVISLQWFVQWCHYTGYTGDALPNTHTQTKHSDNKKPGPIDNTTLIIPDRQWHELNKTIDQNELVILNSHAYLLLASWYNVKDNIVLKRQCVSVGFHRELRIDLYPIFLKLNILQVNSSSETTSMIVPYNNQSKLIDIIQQYQPADVHSSPPNQSYVTGSHLNGRIWCHAEALNDPSTLQKNELQRVYSDSDSKQHSIDEKDSTEQHAAEIADSWQLVSYTQYNHTLEYLEYDSGYTLLIEYRNKDGNWSKSSSTKSWPILDYEVGDRADVYDSQNKWYQATVKAVNSDNTLKIGFDGWPEKFDEHINPITQKLKFKPCNTITCGPHIPKPKNNQNTDLLNNARNRHNSMHSENTTNAQRGAVGLRNLGNTCFMNSTLQCLSNTPILTPYFESKQYIKEINRTNPLGWKGRIAEEYGALIQDMWSGQYSCVTPRMFKQVIGEFQPRFSGYAQHDSSELLSFLLDGLHEDLNRVINKPFVPNIESNGRPDAVVAAEAWKNHLLRNQSKIVDTVQGQLKSTVICPTCNRQSVTFDPFTFLSVPIPGTTTETYIITVILSIQTQNLLNNTIQSPVSIAVKVNKNASVADLKAEIIKVLNNTHITTIQQLHVAEIFQHCIYTIYGDTDECNWGKRDEIVCYEYPVDTDSMITEKLSESDDDMLTVNNTATSESKPVYMIFQQYDPNHTSTTYIQQTNIGVPVYVGLTANDLQSITYTGLLAKLKHAIASIVLPEYQAEFAEINLFDVCKFTVHTDYKCVSTVQLTIDNTTDTDTIFELQQYLDNNKPVYSYINKNEAITLKCYFAHDKLHMLNTDVQGSVTKHTSVVEYDANKHNVQHVTLLDCIDDFLKSEILGASEAWYCSVCKQHKQASKKFDLFKLPDILMIHLKRFQYTNLHREKIDQLIDFPITSLDLSPYMQHTDNNTNTQYDLYAVSNHYGGLGGGHYTAFAQNLIDHNWYRLDDSLVTRVNDVNDVRTSAAYVLFYKRKYLNETNNSSVKTDYFNGMTD